MCLKHLVGNHCEKVIMIAVCIYAYGMQTVTGCFCHLKLETVNVVDFTNIK